MIARLLLLTLASAAAFLAGCGGSAARAATEVEISVHFSRFRPETITVAAGVPVTFILRNEDPIEHEWIIGAPEVHERHRLGTEPYHDTVPTEVTLPAYSERRTTLQFDQPGEYEYICHLPGHEAYGMRGTLRVTGG